MANYDRIDWVNEAVGGIVSPKERAAARQELLDHMDDHTEALMATGLPRSRALEQACAAMGDPKAVGKHLRRVHQPVLTRLLQVMRGCCITLTVIAALTLFFSMVTREQLFPNWFDGKPFAPDQEWFFGEIPDDSILFRRVCQPQASLPVGDYTLRVDKVAVDQRDGWWEVHMLVEMEGKYLWQDPPVLPPDCRFLVGEQVFAFDHTAFWGHRQGGSYYSWFYPELTEEPEILTLELPCEDKTYALKIDLRGGETYEKAR